MDLEVTATQLNGSDRAEIRLLGPLRVRRADGTLVDHAAWRTRKTVDLLRLLALRVGQPMPVAVLVDCLWPDVPEQRGRASLRTAASTIRSVLGRDCLERRLGGLVMREAWVDAVAFTALAKEARSCVREKLPSRAVAVAREAEALYLEDFRADDENGPWASHEREVLSETYRNLLEDTADAALSLGWHRDAASFAARAIERDPCAERPARVLMTAYAAMGQTERALREFQRCRSALAEELGVDPSAQTHALHLQVLRGDTSGDVRPDVPFVGRQAQLHQLVTALSEAFEHDLPTVVELCGDAGSGRRRLLDEACTRTNTTWHRADGAQGALPPGAVRVMAPEELARVSHAPGGLSTLRPERGGVVLATIGTTEQSQERAIEDGWVWHCVTLPPLTTDETAELTSTLLGGAVSPGLVSAVTSETSGNLGLVVAATSDHLRAGRITSTTTGLALVPEDSSPDRDVDAQGLLTRALDQLPPDAYEVMYAVALMASPVRVDALLPALTDEPDRDLVRRALDLLVDLQLLTVSPLGYRFRHPLVASAVRSWLRPSVRRDLHRRIAERLVLPPTDRIDHWLEAGEPQLACAAALDAAACAIAVSRDEEARECLLRARTLSALLGTDPEDQAELAEQLGDVCARLDRHDEATDAYTFALRETPQASPATRVRLQGKRDASAGGRLVLESVATAYRPSSAGRSWTLEELSEQLGVPVDTAPTAEVEEVLHSALRTASTAPGADAADRAAAIRILLVNRVLVPRRQLTRAREILDAVPSLTSRPDLLGRANLSRWMPDVLLGNARSALAPIEAAIAALEGGTEVAISARLRMLGLLALHDLGVTPATTLADDDARRTAGPYWRWLTVRVLAESGRLDEAESWQQEDADEPRLPLVRQLDALATAELYQAQGRFDAALAVLRASADDAVEAGCTLLLPEVAARLVVIECRTDEGRARDDFDIVDWAMGAEPAHPRESFFRLLARAYVRAGHGEFDRGAVAALSAGHVASGHGLDWLAARAERVSRGFTQDARTHALVAVPQPVPTPRAVGAGVMTMYTSLPWPRAATADDNAPRPLTAEDMLL